MIDPLKGQLEAEISKSGEYQRAYESLVKPFIDAKQAELFAVFRDLPTTKPDDLLTVKLQSNALKMLEDEFVFHINTGKLASRTLEELIEKEKSND